MLVVGVLFVVSEEIEDNAKYWEIEENDIPQQIESAPIEFRRQQAYEYLSGVGCLARHTPV